MIERNIFQTYATRDLPPEVESMTGWLREMNPDHRYRFFDDREVEEYIAGFHPGRILDAYRRLNIGAARADLFRYLVLHNEGGCYLDIDSMAEVPFDLIASPSDRAVLSRERNAGAFVQWCLVAAKGHRLLARTIGVVLDNIESGRMTQVHRITGPLAFAGAIRSLYQGPRGMDPYHTDDGLLNAASADARFFGFDYEGLCRFKHPAAASLYRTRPHWTREQLTVPVVAEVARASPPSVPP